MKATGLENELQSKLRAQLLQGFPAKRRLAGPREALLFSVLFDFLRQAQMQSAAMQCQAARAVLSGSSGLVGWGSVQVSESRSWKRSRNSKSKGATPSELEACPQERA